MTITGALMIAVYAIVNGEQERLDVVPRRSACSASRWRSSLVFLFIETHASTRRSCRSRLFKLRNLATADVVGVLWAAAMFAAVLPVGALHAARARVQPAPRSALRSCPSNLIMAVLSIGLSAKLVMRFGFRAPLATGLGLAGAGILSARVRAATMRPTS